MTPVEMLIYEHGETATIRTPSGADSSNYDPDQEFSPTDQGGAGTSVIGAFTGALQAGEEQNVSGKFIVETLPDGVEPMKSILTRASGKAYLITDSKERSFAGTVDGYELHLRG